MASHKRVCLNVIETVNQQDKCEKNEIFILHIHQSCVNFVVNEWNDANHVLLYTFIKYLWKSIENSYFGSVNDRNLFPGELRQHGDCLRIILVSKFELSEKSRLGRVVWDVYGQNMSKILCSSFVFDAAKYNCAKKIVYKVDMCL